MEEPNTPPQLLKELDSPDPNESLNVRYMKQFTGNTSMYARLLYDSVADTGYMTRKVIRHFEGTNK